MLTWFFFFYKTLNTFLKCGYTHGGMLAKVCSRFFLTTRLWTSFNLKKNIMQLTAVTLALCASATEYK